MKNSDTLLVGFDHSNGDIAVLIVGRKAFAERSLSLPEKHCSFLFEDAYDSIEKVCERLHSNWRKEAKKQ